MIADIIIFSFYLVPILIIAYLLIKILFSLIYQQKWSQTSKIEGNISFYKTKVSLTIIGIFYCLVIMCGILITALKPEWLQIPVWAKMAFIIFAVPYFACIYGIVGLGNIGRSGFSPWKDFKLVIGELKKSHK